MASVCRLPARTNNPPTTVKFVKHEMKPSIVAASKKKKIKPNGGSLKYNPALSIYCGKN